MMTVRNDTSLSQDDKRAKMMDIRKISSDKIRAILTDDQKTKYDALQAEMRERMKERSREERRPATAIIGIVISREQKAGGAGLFRPFCVWTPPSRVPCGYNEVTAQWISGVRVCLRPVWTISKGSSEE